MPGGAHKYDGTALLTSEGKLCSDAFHCKGSVPFLEEYMRSQLKQTSMLITKAEELYEGYKDYVQKMTDDPQSLDALHTVTIERFRGQFSDKALHWNWRKARIGGVRGYCVQLCRIQRLQRPTGQTPASAVQAYLPTSHEAMVYERLWRKMFLNETIGVGSVTTKVIAPYTVVAEYLGQLIPETLADEREKEYEKNGAKCTMFKFQGAQAFDGQRDHNGLLLICGNPGAVLNHSIEKANCKAVAHQVNGRLRLFIYSTKTVAAGIELVYDYADRRRGLEDWLQH